MAQMQARSNPTPAPQNPTYGGASSNPALGQPVMMTNQPNAGNGIPVGQPITVTNPAGPTKKGINV